MCCYAVNDICMDYQHLIKVLLPQLHVVPAGAGSPPPLAPTQPSSAIPAVERLHMQPCPKRKI